MIFLTLLLLAPIADADPAQFKLGLLETTRFNRLSRNTLDHPTVSAIAQDHKGYLWFGTSFGVYRYDGTNTLSYRKDPHREGGLPHNWINALLVDSNDHLWISTNQGTVILDRESGAMTPVEVHSDGRPVGEPPYSGDMVQVGNWVWVTCYPYGLVAFDLEGRQQKIIHFPDLLFPTSFLAGSFVALPNQQLLLAQADKVWRLDLVSETWTGVVDGHKPGLFVDDLGLVWITSPDGVYILETPDAPPHRLDLGEIKAYKMVMEKPGQYWFSGEDGLWQATFEQAQKPWQGSVSIKPFGFDAINHTNMPSNSILCLFREHSGTLWAGSYAEGAFYWSQGQQPVQYFSIFHQTTGAVAWAACFVESPQGDFLVGTRGQGLYRVDVEQQKAKPLELPQLRNQWAMSLLYNPNGDLLVSTGKGLLTVPKDKSPPTLDPQVPVTYEMRWYQNRLWLASTVGVYTYDPATKSLEVVRQSNAFAFAEDRDGALWIASGGEGLLRYENQEWHALAPIINDPGSFPSFHVRTLCYDDWGRLWVGTDAGLVQVLEDKEHFVHWRDIQLPSPIISAIEVDRLGRVWISSISQLVRLDPEQKTTKLFTANEGFPESYLIGSSLALKNGTFAFGGFNGFAVFEPTQTTLNENAPMLDLAITVRGPRSEIKEPLLANPDSPLVLSPNRRWINLEMRALHFALPQQNRYSYRMVGLSDEWTEVNGDQRFLTFNGLAPGTYRFEFKAANADGVWSKTPLTQTFVVQPGFWETWMADLVAFFLAVVLLGFLILWQRKRHAQAMRAKNREMQIQVLEGRLHETRLASLRSHLQPHFLFNTLNGISALIRSNQVDLADTLIADFSELFRIVLNRKDEKFISLREEMDFTRKYLNVERVRFQDRLTLEVSWDSRYADFPIPPLLIQPLVENAIKHGISRVRGPVWIQLKVGEERGNLVIRVEDNGPGFDDQGHVGIGLQNIRERLALHYAEKGLLTCGNRDSGGASVCMVLPLADHAPKPEIGSQQSAEPAI